MKPDNRSNDQVTCKNWVQEDLFSSEDDMACQNITSLGLSPVKWWKECDERRNKMDRAEYHYSGVGTDGEMAPYSTKRFEMLIK